MHDRRKCALGLSPYRSHWPVVSTFHRYLIAVRKKHIDGLAHCCPRQSKSWMGVVSSKSLLFPQLFINL
eukprot:3301974-Amphidinium_carterae.1